MLGPCLKEILKAEGKSTYRLSKDLNIEQSQLSRYFNGKGSISIKKYELILDHFDYEMILNKTMRGEGKEVKSGALVSERTQMSKDYRYILKCLKCNTIFDYYPGYGKRLPNGPQHTVCEYCSRVGYVAVIRAPIPFVINTEK